LKPVIDNFEQYFALTEAALAPKRVFIHAGVVGYRGSAIIVPGKTFSGKSTLVSELIKAGADYYSDEYAVIDNSGRVHPYLRPISLRGENGFKSSVCAENLGGVTGSTPLPVGMLIFTTYKPGAKWRPKSVTSGQAFLDMLANCVGARIAPHRTVDFLERLAACPVRIKTSRPDAQITAEKILKLLEEHAENGAGPNRDGQLAA
jgi:hypothetical protein